MYELGVITCQVTQEGCWSCFGETVGGRKDIRRCMMGRSFCDHEDTSGTKSLHPVTKQAAAGPSCQGEGLQ